MPMFWWFKRGDQFLRYESRAVTTGTFELTVVMPDGTERVEKDTDQERVGGSSCRLRARTGRRGWTGPHGWNL
jgi:hypothetical protein